MYLNVVQIAEGGTTMRSPRTNRRTAASHSRKPPTRETVPSRVLDRRAGIASAPTELALRLLEKALVDPLLR